MRKGFGLSVLFVFLFSACAPVATVAPVQPTRTITVSPTHTAFPTNTATVTPPPILTGCVKDVTLRVRSGPGTSYKVVNSLTAGTCVPVSGRNSDSSWLLVDLGGSTGWVSAAYVEVRGEVTTLPIEAVTVAVVPTFTKVAMVNYPSPAPVAATVDSTNGASAICNDGTYSYSAHRRGTCSHHGGVKVWLKNLPP
jgi:SH3-like domain-containing protein